MPESTIAVGKDSEGGARRQQNAARQLSSIADAMEADFKKKQRVLAFGEYLELFASHPIRYGRSAVHYVRDLFQHFGTTQLDRPWGKSTRFNLFDAPWRVEGEGSLAEPRLIGHEALQQQLYRALYNFARDGRANRLILMHGPNGSAKSTAAACILRALEVYSESDEGALYRFHWIFPSRRTSRGSIGFGGGTPSQELDSFAHLEDEQIDARLVIELRDHPLFLLPAAHRRKLLETVWQDVPEAAEPPEWVLKGELCHKNKQIFEALLASYGGSLRDVLRHVQVERYFISRRYRTGAVTLGPEMTVDGGERQVTADRSLSALPTSLQATTLFEAYGELVEAAGGVLEFSDLLKRPLDAFRYLQQTLETGEVALPQQNITTNVVMVGSANEVHLAAFREHPEYASFRGRLETVRVPYLRSYKDEQCIYEQQIVAHLRQHCAPHATRLAAQFAVLSRMRRPDPKSYPEALKSVVEGLSAVEKMELYAGGMAPERLKTEERKLLKARVDLLYGETATDVDYEGGIGVSPRLMRTLLLDAAQSSEYFGLSPFAVLKELDSLCKRTAEYDWLKLKPLTGGYHDHESFREVIRTHLFDWVEADFREASGLIEEGRYNELFTRYIDHVSVWIKGEKVRNEVTGKDEAADERLMSEVEGLLGVEGDAGEHRQSILSAIAAWAIDHQGDKPVHEEIFPGYVTRLSGAAFAKLRKPFSELLRHIVGEYRDKGVGMDAAHKKLAHEAVARLADFGYVEQSALDAASALLRERFADIVT